MPYYHVKVTSSRITISSRISPRDQSLRHIYSIHFYGRRALNSARSRSPTISVVKHCYMSAFSLLSGGERITELVITSKDSFLFHQHATCSLRSSTLFKGILFISYSNKFGMEMPLTTVLMSTSVLQ